ncbi:MAG: triose-phosphate isomerase [Nitrospinae bacterium]|nr:triose-phosphate isomerase [Nitrospinota bacterium]MCH8931734.1 triose-phosphate isomerase [Nitrospinota bacterium]MCZ6541765.1 triose-phosphate isomerase [Nitrospinota bacterium]TDJ53482.1 MAG: triose-phosphate isomerase [Nitrospina sp.]
MRKPLIAGNWKMNKTVPESLEMIRALRGRLDPSSPAEVVLIPSFTALFSAAEALRGSGIHLGAQNLSHLSQGAVTGEVSGTQLKSVGCRYVLVGHSERRQLFQEDDALVHQKLKTALSEGLYPMLCVGETLEQREAGQTRDIIGTQLQEGLKGLTPPEIRKVVVAYEPVWAIGTGKNAQPEQAQDIHEFIRGRLVSQFGEDTAQDNRIVYGGSVTPENSPGLLAQPDIDGALVGGASLDADLFYAIIDAVP